MNTPNHPVPPPVHEMWKTFSLVARGKDPLGTITSRDLLDGEGTQVFAGAGPGAPVSISDLPSVPVSATTPSGESVATDFEIVGVLGEGGMGRVLLARQRSLQRDVALKVLKSNASRPDIVDTLLTEAVVTGSIEHPNIVPIHALGRDKSGLPVLVMKRIDGVSWRKLYEQPEHPMWNSLCADDTYRFDVHLEIFMSVCNAVHYANSRGIVHRDIKLDNVMMGAFGEVYLVDWGIALSTASSPSYATEAEDFIPPVGTLAYMAPEMALGDIRRIDARTDVYLLGATLHYLLTGKPRHRGETPLELLLSARDSEKVEYDSTVPRELAEICNRAMHVDREKRFSSALEFRKALEEYQRHRGSLVLSAKATEQLAGLNKGAPMSELTLRRVMTECRFAFMQALEAWPGNTKAREGLDKVLEKMIDYAVERKEVNGAQMLLVELSAPRSDLQAHVESLRDRLEQEKRDAERLQELARNTDLRIGARYQFVVLLTFPVCALVSVLVVLAIGNVEVMVQLFTFPIVVVLVATAVYLALQQRIRTLIARRSFLLACLYPASMLVHRIFAVLQGDALHSILITDLIIMMILTIVLSIAVFPRVIYISAAFLLGAVAISMYPAHSVMIFTVSAVLGALRLAAYWGQMINMSDDSAPNESIQ